MKPSKERRCERLLNSKNPCRTAPCAHPHPGDNPVALLREQEALVSVELPGTVTERIAMTQRTTPQGILKIIFWYDQCAGGGNTVGERGLLRPSARISTLSLPPCPLMTIDAWLKQLLLQSVWYFSWLRGGQGLVNEVSEWLIRSCRGGDVVLVS